jgi:hypothetical protein
MPINSYKLGPGVFTLGSGPLAVSAQVTSMRVVPAEEVKSRDAIPVLSGEEIPAEEDASVRFTLEGTFLQDIKVAGVVDYTWTHSGEEVPWSYEPNSAVGATVDGVARVVPLVIGGDEIKARPASDFTWRVIGTPDFTPGPA